MSPKKSQSANTHNADLRAIGVVGVIFLNAEHYFKRGQRRPFEANINVDGKRLRAGRYADPVSAAKAYNTYAEIYGGKHRNPPEVMAALEAWWKRKGRPL